MERELQVFIDLAGETGPVAFSGRAPVARGKRPPSSTTVHGCRAGTRSAWIGLQ